MSPIALAISATTAPLILLGGVAGRTWRVWGAIVLLIATLAVGVSAGVLAVSDLWQLPDATGLSSDLMLLMLWAVLGAVVRAGGPLKISGPPVLVALVTGALLGEVPAAAILSAGARSKGGAARLALAAAAGGMLGRLGDPAVLLLSERDPSILLYLAPLGLILAVLAGPGREDLGKPAAGSGVRTLLLLGVAGAACVPGWSIWAVLAGIIGSLILGRARLREVDLRHVAWIGAAAMIGLVGIAGGLPELAGTGLEYIGEQLGSWGAPALTLGGAVLAALSDGTAAAVWSLAVLDGAMSLKIPGAVLGLAAGIAVGGFGPLIAAGAWRAGWKRWCLQVLVTVLYVWLVTS